MDFVMKYQSLANSIKCSLHAISKHANEDLQSRMLMRPSHTQSWEETSTTV
ncbi:hypothetical protein STEG23_028111, partial [Scotinomys teguina]